MFGATPSPSAVVAVGAALDWTTFVPTGSAIIALAALLTNIIMTNGQRAGDNRVAANSVLINVGPGDKQFTVTNGGKGAILELQMCVDAEVLNDDPIALASSGTHTFTRTGDELAQSFFSHAVYVDFTDARGKKWRKTPNKAATRR